MESKNIVFIARSLDGFIAGKDGELDWLHSEPNPDQDDMGYTDLMKEIDAIVMGRTTYEVVLSFEGDWPYSKHVFVLSNTLKEVPKDLKNKVTILSGEPKEILTEIHNQGYFTLYIDGGRTIQDFMKADLIDELRITTIPILLGGGFPLFGDLDNPIRFNHIKSEVFLGQLVQDWYQKKF